jgi:hypothetical protein
MLRGSIKKCYNKNNGYIVLLSVLLVGAVASAIVITSLTLGLDRSRTAFTALNSTQALMLAETCAEVSLQEIDNDNTFTGSATLNPPEGECQYTVVDIAEGVKEIRARGEKHNNIRKVLIETQELDPEIIISSWKEVKEF